MQLHLNLRTLLSHKIILCLPKQFYLFVTGGHCSPHYFNSRQSHKLLVTGSPPEYWVRVTG